jgi:hypothetical protein
MDDLVAVPIRLDHDVLLTLTHRAHDAGMSLNELCVAIMVNMLRQRRPVASRNKREGWYCGKGYDAAGNVRQQRSVKGLSLARYRGMTKRTKQALGLDHADD